MHQFNKVEQFIFSTPEDSWTYHEELLKNAEDLHQMLEIPYRVVNDCTGDIGTVAAKKYDIEAWSPRQGKYVEVVSCSNCTDYQARRLRIRVGKVGGEKRVLHTLNSTALATSRTLVAILENNQTADGSVTVPKALRPYMKGMEVITAKSQ
jgi:seryl-tRNA synthetase